MITDYYTLQATVYSIVESINELGSDESSTQFTVVTNITGALETVVKSERFIDGTDMVWATHRFYGGITSSVIRERHVLRIGTNDYDIKSVSNPMQMNHHQEILMELRT